VKRFSARKTANLSESIHKQLNMYAIAAGAAGVSILALVQPAEAKVVYTSANGKLDGKPLPIDLNHDGIPEDVSNGLLFVLLKNVDPSAETTVSFVAASSKLFSYS
jgi:hypothetical protein